MFDIHTAGGERRAEARRGGLPVLFVGQAGAPTGFARVVHSILECLPGDWAPHLLGVNFAGHAPECGYTVHPNPAPGDIHAEAELPRVIARIRPRIVLVVDEVWACAKHRALFEPGRPFKTVLYAAIDRPKCVTPELAAAVAGLDSLVAFTRYGRRVVEVAVRRRRRQAPGFTFPPVAVIPHGVDTRVFRPLAGDPERGELVPARRAARHLLFADRPDVQDAFIVLNANRNQPAKRIDLTIEGFARFARDKPANVKLYLHMATRKRSAGEVPLVDRFGVRERVLGVTTGARHPALTSAELNVLYNACDVGVNTSEGEGWGLVAFEHAATGAPQIVPRHSACEEQWRGAAVLLDPVRRLRLEGCQKSGRTVTPDALAEALERLYRDEGHRRAMSAAAYRNATRPEYQWAEIARAWSAHFHGLLCPSLPPQGGESPSIQTRAGEA